MARMAPVRTSCEQARALQVRHALGRLAGHHQAVVQRLGHGVLELGLEHGQVLGRGVFQPLLVTGHEGGPDAQAVGVELVGAVGRAPGTCAPPRRSRRRIRPPGARPPDRRPRPRVGIDGRGPGRRVSLPAATMELQDHGPPAVGGVQVGEGGVALGELDHARDHGRLTGSEGPHVLAEEQPGGGLDAVGALPQVDLVQVHGQDLVLGVDLLDLHGEDHLAGLAGEGLLEGQEQVAGQLHGEGAGPGTAAAQDVVQDDLHHALHVDAVVLIEAAILDGDHGVLEVLRNALQGHDGAVLGVELLQGVPIGRQDDRLLRRLDVA